LRQTRNRLAARHVEIAPQLISINRTRPDRATPASPAASPFRNSRSRTHRPPRHKKPLHLAGVDMQYRSRGPRAQGDVPARACFATQREGVGGRPFVDASQHTPARKGGPPIGGFATCQQARHRLTIPGFVGRLRIGRGFLSREGLGCVPGGPCTADTVGTSSHCCICCIALQHLVRLPLRLPRI
jgi:hypothetical protein